MTYIIVDGTLCFDEAIRLPPHTGSVVVNINGTVLMIYITNTDTIVRDIGKSFQECLTKRAILGDAGSAYECILSRFIPDGHISIRSSDIMLKKAVQVNIIYLFSA